MLIPNHDSNNILVFVSKCFSAVSITSTNLILLSTFVEEVHERYIPYRSCFHLVFIIFVRTYFHPCLYHDLAVYYWITTRTYRLVHLSIKIWVENKRSKFFWENVHSVQFIKFYATYDVWGINFIRGRYRIKGNPREINKKTRTNEGDNNFNLYNFFA